MAICGGSAAFATDVALQRVKICREAPAQVLPEPGAMEGLNPLSNGISGT
jgi:hypothetical protein